MRFLIRTGAFPQRHQQDLDSPVANSAHRRNSFLLKLMETLEPSLCSLLEPSDISMCLRPDVLVAFIARHDSISFLASIETSQELIYSLGYCVAVWELLSDWRALLSRSSRKPRNQHKLILTV